VRRARRVWRRDRALAETEARLTARLEGWEAATPLFLRLADPAAGLTDAPRAASPLSPVAAPPAARLLLPARGRPEHLPPGQAAGIVLYTATFGEDPPPGPLLAGIPGLRCLWLTDRPRAVPGWESLAFVPDPADPADPAAHCKILPHRALAAAAPGARASLYVAPGMLVAGNLHTLFGRWLDPEPDREAREEARDKAGEEAGAGPAPRLALWRHDRAAGWHDLAEALLTEAAETDPAPILAQARAFAAEGLPVDAGAWDDRVIWRRHGDPAVAALMEAWWAERAARPGADALALAACLARRGSDEGDGEGKDEGEDGGLRPAVPPGLLGPAADNAFFAALPPPPPPRAPRPATSPAPAAAPAPAGRPLPVAFLYAERYAASASTFLRGAQLAEMVAARYPERYAVTWTSDAGALRDRVVVVTKWALKELSAAEIAALAARNVAVIGSWDDMLPDPEKVAATDATMALSHRQTLDMRRLYPDRPAYFVTHHVNPQVPPIEPPADRLRTGYFGHLPNTVRPPSLAGMVELVDIPTSVVDTAWLAALPRFNAHWILRRRKPIDGWKPFLKGFLAARCGAVPVVARDEEDALFYLGDDYPFFVRGLSEAELETDMAEMAAAFGGPEWRHARAIMDQVAARSTDDLVCAEFHAMIEDIAVR
jgi:hypothetical protein